MNSRILISALIVSLTALMIYSILPDNITPKNQQVNSSSNKAESFPVNSEKIEQNNIYYKAKIANIINPNEVEILIVLVFDIYIAKTLYIERSNVQFEKNEWIWIQANKEFNDNHGKYSIQAFNENKKLVFEAVTLQ